MSNILASLSYLLSPIVAPLVLLLRRKDYFALYHACQALAILAGFALVFVGWLVLGWLVSFVSITVPQIYVLPIVWALLAPLWGLIKRSRRYQGRGVWGSMVGTVILAIIFGWAAWRAIEWLAPDVLPLAGPLLQMSTFALVIAAAITAVIGIIMGIIYSLRGLARKALVFGPWGERWFNWITRKERAALEASDAAAALAAELAAADSPAMMADLVAEQAADKATLADTPLTSSTMT